MSVAGDPAWTVVVPLKRLDLAKTRLDDGGDAAARPLLALAFARDVVAAARACPSVVDVVVVTDDPRATAVLRAQGAHVVGDPPGGGLNRAIEHGAEVARGRHAHAGVAALAGDLPALRSDELERALVAAWPRRRTYVPDAEGSGTTLLTARPGIGLNPSFGVLSADEHFASGAAPFEPDDIPGLRRDVDTAGDLEAAVALGVGPATAELLAAAREA
jgi:2-phospho-L-lactate guanylyltransferase